MQVECYVLIPERKKVVDTTGWQHISRQLYWLSDGRRDDRRIAALLHRDIALIRKAITALVGSGELAVRNERKVLTMQVGLLRESFDMVAKFGDTFAVWFYGYLLHDYPEVATLFAHTDMRRQASSLTATLAAVIAGIERDENLVPVLQQLGRKHAGYGVKVEYYPLVGATLLRTFHRMLGSRFTPDMEEAWSQAFEIISNVMVGGATEKET